MNLSEPDPIRSLRVRAVRVPMREPHRTASGVITESPLVLCDLTTEHGVMGHSMVFTYTPAALKPTADLLANLEPLVVGQALDPIALEQSLASRFRLLGPQGLVGIALAAIDMAAWDALARYRDQSLVALLGAEPKPIPAYGAVGYDGPRTSATVAGHWRERGFHGVKAKIGYPTVEQDLAVIRAMRSAVGDDFNIMVDYNQCLSVSEAISRIQALEGEGLTWIEEPTLAHDYQGHAQIAAQIKTPIQCGENWWGSLDLQHAIDASASDYLMPDVMKIGGVSGWRRAARIAQQHSLKVSNHLWPEISAQLLSLTPTAHWLEYADWWNPILAAPLVVNNGYTDCGNTLGTGVSWDEDAVTAYLA